MIPDKSTLKTKKWFMNILEAIDQHIYYDMGSVSQFTIDFVQELIDEMYNERNFYPQLDPDDIDEDCLKFPDPDVIGSIHYKIVCIMEIMDECLIDYQLFQKLDKMFADIHYSSEDERDVWQRLMDADPKTYDTTCEWLNTLPD